MSTGTELSYASFTGTFFGREVDSAGVVLAGANFLDMGELYPLEIQVASKEVKAKSRKVETAGQTVGSKAEIDEISGSMTLRQWNAWTIARLVSGEETKLTGAGGTMPATEFTAPLPGQWIELGHEGFTSLTVTLSPAGTSYVLDVDYKYNAALGLFTSVPGGALAAGTVEVLIGGAYAAESGYRIEVGTRAKTMIQMKGELYNEFSGKKHKVECDCVQLTASKAVNLVSEAGSEGEFLEFNLTFITVPGKTSPVRIDGVPM